MLESNVTTKPMTDVSRSAARLAFATSAAFIILLAALHVLKPDLDPSWHFISEYQIGDYGWLMRLAFFSLALSCAGLGIAILSQTRTVAGYLGLVLLALSAAGMVIGGIFVTDPIAATADGRTADGRLHELGAMLDSVPFAAVLINWSLARNRAWSGARQTLLWTAFLPLIGLVVFIVSLAVMLPANEGRLGPEVLIGWPNRIMILAHCAWLMPVARAAFKLPG